MEILWFERCRETWPLLVPTALWAAHQLHCHLPGLQKQRKKHTSKSPEILAPARIPVAAGKKMAKTEKKPSPFVKLGPKFSANIDAATQIMRNYHVDVLHRVGDKVTFGFYSPKCKWVPIISMKPKDVGVLLINLMLIFAKANIYHKILDL